jgi:hypothetical protein
MAPTADWKRLAAAVKARREEIGLPQYKVSQVGGPATETVRKIERADGTLYTRDVITKLENALRWAHGSWDAILRGGHATPVGEQDDTAGRVSADVEFIASVYADPLLSAEDKSEVIATYMAELRIALERAQRELKLRKRSPLNLVLDVQSPNVS